MLKCRNQQKVPMHKYEHHILHGRGSCWASSSFFGDDQAILVSEIFYLFYGFFVKFISFSYFDYKIWTDMLVMSKKLSGKILALLYFRDMRGCHEEKRELYKDQGFH